MPARRPPPAPHGAWAPFSALVPRQLLSLRRKTKHPHLWACVAALGGMNCVFQIATCFLRTDLSSIHRTGNIFLKRLHSKLTRNIGVHS